MARFSLIFLFYPRENRSVWYLHTSRHTSRGDRLLHDLQAAMPSRNHVFSKKYRWIYLVYMFVFILPSSTQFYLWCSHFLRAGRGQQSLLPRPWLISLTWLSGDGSFYCMASFHVNLYKTITQAGLAGLFPPKEQCISL